MIGATADDDAHHQSKVWTPSHLMGFLYFYMYLKKERKKINNSKYVSYFRFLKVATLCFLDIAANLWPSLNE